MADHFPRYGCAEGGHARLRDQDDARADHRPAGRRRGCRDITARQHDEQTSAQHRRRAGSAARHHQFRSTAADDCRLRGAAGGDDQLGAGADHQAAVLVGQPEEKVGAKPRLHVLVGDVVDRRAIDKRMPDIF